MKASTIRSTWSLNTPSRPIRSAGRRMCVELHVPAEAHPVEAVEQGRQAAVPIAVVQVDGVDAPRERVAARRSGPSRSRLSRGRVDELDVGIDLAQPGQQLDVLLAQPQAGEHVRRSVADRRDHGRPGPHVLQVQREVVVAAAAFQAGRRAPGCAPAAPRGAAGRSAACAGPIRTTPSWSSTGTPSLVSQTSLSNPVAPSRSPSSNASSVFSRAWARAPRWAKAIGRARSEGSRCCTSADDGRPLDCPRVQRLRGRDHRHPAAGARRAGTGEAPRGPAASRAHIRRAEEDGQQLPDRDAQRPRRADEGDARHRRPAPQGRRRDRRDGDDRHPRGHPRRAGPSSTNRCPRSPRRWSSWSRWTGIRSPMRRRTPRRWTTRLQRAVPAEPVAPAAPAAPPDGAGTVRRQPRTGDDLINRTLSGD